MNSFDSYLLRKLHQKTAKHGDKLAKIEKMVNWNKFHPIITSMYNNKTPRGGRPNMSPVLMVKLLVLQAWYGLSDPELERQASFTIMKSSLATPSSESLNNSTSSNPYSAFPHRFQHKIDYL